MQRQKQPSAARCSQLPSVKRVSPCSSKEAFYLWKPPRSPGTPNNYDSNSRRGAVCLGSPCEANQFPAEFSRVVARFEVCVLFGRRDSERFPSEFLIRSLFFTSFLLVGPEKWRCFQSGWADHIAHSPGKQRCAFKQLNHITRISLFARAS